MKTTKLFLGLASVLAMGLCASCTDDKVDGPSSITDAVIEDGVYMQFTLELPTTRSETTSTTDDGYGTSSNGIEVGQSYENIISKVYVVLLDASNASNSPITTATATPISAGSDTYVVAFESKDLESHLDKTINVFVYCNPINEVDVTSFSLDAAYTLTSASDATAWTSDSFLMSNAQLHQSTIPESLSSYKSEATPLDLGIVYVERSMARFDFMDGSASEYNTYNMGNGISITLTDIALINMSSSFYYVRRVSDDGTATSGTNFAYCGTEWSAWTDRTDPDTQTGNYVVDTDATAKAFAATSGTSNLVSNFYYPMSAPTTWEWTTISSILSGTPDNSGTYNIWRYVTENTIPAGVDNQVKGITTGVVFKGLINVDDVESGDNSGLIAAMAAREQIFEYENTLYGSWAMIETLAASGATTEFEQLIIIAYNEVQDLMYNTDGTETGVLLAEAQAQAGFTGFSPDSNGDYYTYYYYWNRHNNNGFDGVMGIMEFDVVRNNVYKLSVTGINSFGHPTPGGSDPDPDPEDPDAPDESNEVYIQVEVQILPWVVRVNDITF